MVMPVMGMAVVLVPMLGMVIMCVIVARVIVVLVIMIFVIMAMMPGRMMVVAAAAGIVVLVRRLVGLLIVLMRRVSMPVMIMTVVIMVLVPVIMMPVIMMPVIMAMLVMPMVIVAAVMAGDRALGPERPFDRRQAAALAAGQFGDGVVLRHIDRVRRHLHRRMGLAEMPEDTHQSQRVFRPHFQQLLIGRRNGDETAVLELEGVAVVELGVTRQIDGDGETAGRRQMRAGALPGQVVERDRIDDTLALHCGLADDGIGPWHGRDPFKTVDCGYRPRTLDRAMG